MEIQGDRPLDPASRRRQADAARGPRAGTNAPVAARTPDAVFTPGDSSGVARLVGILRNMNPSDVHKVDQLKNSIADGTYRADPEELADLLLGDKEPAPREQRG